MGGVLTEPQIRYATTSDGISIAYAVTGKGMPFLFMPSIPFSFTAGHSQVPEWQAWNEQIRERGMLIRYDCRGAGLSDRAISEFSLDAWLLDLEAVVDSVGLDRFVLFAPSGPAGPVAIAYAARWPERVSELILWQAYARVPRSDEQPALAAVLHLVETNWVLFTETMAHSVEGWSEPEAARRAAALMRENHSPSGLKAAFAAAAGIDVSDLLPSVKARTLVLHRRESGHDLALSKQVATQIPSAGLVVVEGNAASWALQHPDAVLQAIDEFVAEGVEQAPKPSSGMTAILFTDIADSTALTERMGDTAFRAAARALDERLQSAVRGAGGTTIEGKTLGDGVLAVFTSAAQAIDAARECVEISGESELRLHIGLHAGDVIREEGNVFGGTVNIAARICGMSPAGEILVSGTIRDLARTSAGVAFEDRGKQLFKGIDEPVRVFAVRSP